MEADCSELICCPKCKKDLHYSGSENASPALSGVWRCQQCACEFPVNEGFIHFISQEEVFQFSKRTEFFRRINARFYTPITDFMFLPCGGAHHARRQVLENLELQKGSTILETGIGTGDNIHFLGNKLDECLLFGLDNQLRMLQTCARNTRKWKKTVKLYRANAEELPFKDNSFDVVFHLGAFNLFQHKQEALNEMIRVAKPGSRIVIADETEKASKLFAILIGKQEPVVPPIDLVPVNMLQISLKIIWNGFGYLITFRKPG